MTVIWKIIVTLIFSVPSIATDQISRYEYSGGGFATINWSNGTITATGKGTVNPSGNIESMRQQALNSAQTTAHLNLEKALSLLIDDSYLHNKDDINFTLKNMANSAYTHSEQVVWYNMENAGKIPEATITIRLCLFKKHPSCNNYVSKDEKLYKGLLILDNLVKNIPLKNDPN